MSESEKSRGKREDEAEESAEQMYQRAKALKDGSLTHTDVLAEYQRQQSRTKSDIVAEHHLMLELFHRAGDLGHADACYELGELYSGFFSKNVFLSGAEGTDVDLDSERALRYYRIAAENGSTGALYRLGCFYEDGHPEMGVEQNSDLSWSMFKKCESLKLAQITEKDKQEKVQKWKDSIGTAQDLEDALRSGAIALLSSTWLVEFASASPTNVIQPRQMLPKEAFLPFEDLVYATSTISGNLRVSALSYMWLDKDHPDPYGHTLRLVAKNLRKLNRAGTVGIFWDFCSLYQHTDTRKRTQQEDALFRQGLNSLGSLYSHPFTMVYTIQEFPPDYSHPSGCEPPGYNRRGWPFTESCWATHGDKMFKKYSFHYNDSEAEKIPRARTRKVDPPLTPARFATRLGQCVFTNERDDRPLVITLYHKFFRDNYKRVVTFTFQKTDWGDEQVSQMAEIIAEGWVPNLEELRLSSSVITAKGCRAIARALDENVVCPKFRKLDLSDNTAIGNNGLQELAPILCRLESLGRSNCGVGDDGCELLASTLGDIGPNPLLRLFYLDLSNNPIGNSGCDALVRVIGHPALQKSPWGWYMLCLDDCRAIGPHALKRLTSASQEWKIRHTLVHPLIGVVENGTVMRQTGYYQLVWHISAVLLVCGFAFVCQRWLYPAI